MNDKDFIETIAREWIRLGGDSEGVAYNWVRLQRRVNELERDWDSVVKNELEDNMELWERLK